MSILDYELPFDFSSFSLKTVFIVLVISYTIIMAGFLAYNSIKIATPIASYGNMNTIDTPETGPHTYCESNSECWCKKFDGARFLKGKNQSECDQKIHHCRPCYYE